MAQDETRVEKFKRTIEQEMYELHFHSRAHYFSAHHYEKLDQRMTQWRIICSALCIACGGGNLPTMLSSGQLKRIGNKGLLYLTIAFFCGCVVTELYETEHSPAEKKKLHHMAGSKMKALRRKTEAWLATLETSDDDTNEMMKQRLTKYDQIIDDHSKIESEIIRSDDAMFSCVHSTLPEKWRKLGKKVGKYFPPENGKDWGYYWTVAEPYVIMTTWTVVASFGIWKFVTVALADSAK